MKPGDGIEPIKRKCRKCKEPKGIGCCSTAEWNSPKSPCCRECRQKSNTVQSERRSRGAIG